MRESSELVPSPILPAQFHSPPALQAEKRLMVAVLEQALALVHHQRRRNSRRGARALADVEDWFASADTNWPFAFESICDALGLDAGAIRARLTVTADTVPGRGRFPFRRACGRPVAIRLRRRSIPPSSDDDTAAMRSVATHGLRRHGV